MVVQNEGYLQSLSGVKTQETLLSQSNLALSASQAASSASSGTRSSQVQASESASNQSPGYVASAGASGLADLTTSADTSISASASSSYSDDYQTSTFGGVEINTQENVPLEATTALGMVCQLSHRYGAGIGDHRGPGAARLAAARRGRRRPERVSAFSGLYQPIQYWIRVTPDAKPGRYMLPLVCTYKQLVDDYDYASIDRHGTPEQELCGNDNGRYAGHRDHGAVRPGALRDGLYQHGAGHRRYHLHEGDQSRQTCRSSTRSPT